ncbi:high frequency lysogenization protein HflD [Agarilytica rhodophyticola]|uniref:high frequency lysogenization protein HflD n=1 Tax=Agarilytica rhodophyticola TaxID=1737490 RepID=UPI000B349B3A|nr:high frequency lysogenization protein HflD [Agarilytica rhodophyticola]
MEKTWRNIAIALAGAAQAINLVEQLAKTGYLRSEEFEIAVDSLFEQNPENTESVFGSVQQLRLGLQILLSLLESHRDPKNADALRYMLGVIHIQKRLAKRNDVMNIIGSRLQKAQYQVQHFGKTHENVVSNIADIYTDTISKFQYRIQVTGEYSYLQQPRLAAQVRVLLLAAIRAITLWRQIGGSRWQLLFYRNKIIEECKILVEETRIH